ncbi:AAA family ATPase [Coxiella endosymbiont of Ornithodoros amblus]|uniref:AAA family ATPase n=1 Tax=Coxiella endosymbiont of Ornithodoros amblus TaxID=1656166 RepID=UPI00244DFEEB|nr:AAA family ATPase [Coxiella endosymbiont of Ornithodoros amblus]
MENNPAVAILGARQVGKTTLALEVAKKSSVYLDLEEAPPDVAKLQDPTAYFSNQMGKLVVLDKNLAHARTLLKYCVESSINVDSPEWVIGNF